MACTLKLDISSVRNWQKTGSQCVVVSASIYIYNIIFIIFLAVRQDPYSVSGWRLHSCWWHCSSLWCMIPVLCRKVSSSLTIIMCNLILTINIFRISRCRYGWNKWCRGWWWWQWWYWGWRGRWWWWWWNRWWWWRWWRRWTVKWRYQSDFFRVQSNCILFLNRWRWWWWWWHWWRWRWWWWWWW